MRRAVSGYRVPLRAIGLVIALVLLAACAPLGTPTPTPAPTDTPIPQTPEWMVYNTDNSGLPSNRLTPALGFDAQGNLWIGTRTEGVAKFDGENWTVYNRNNSGLPHNGLHGERIPIDAQGNLWIETEGGVAQFDGVNWTVYNTGNSGLPDDFVWSLAIDAQGNKWIGTNWGGLAVYHEGGIIPSGVEE